MSDTPQQTVPSDTQQSEVTQINQQMYEKNLELAIRNKTLSIIRKIYDIINTSFGVSDTTQKLCEAIVTELKFQNVSIALVNKEEKTLVSVARFPQLLPEHEETQSLGKPFHTLSLSLDHEENYCVSSFVHQQTRMTNSLHDLFVPLVPEEQSKLLQEKLNIKTSIIYPIVFNQESLGVLILGIEKHIGDLSRGERETLKELINVVAIAIERAQIYEDLQKANERLKQMDKLKDEFISIVSHELRTPMTAVRSYAWMVLHDKAGPLTDKGHEYMNRVYTSTERLINLVNDMLDVSRIESGRVQLKILPFDIIKLCQDVQAEFQARATERHMNLPITPIGDIPQINGDREKIHQVLENLVGNAFKYTPDNGSITMEITRKEQMIQVAIRDTGKGISQEDMKKLFTKFGRLDNTLVSISEAGGTGLGLFICKQYVEMHKGKIWAESEEGKGTTFLFTLPLVTS